MLVQAINTYNNQPKFGVKVAVVTEDTKISVDYLGRYTKAKKPYNNYTKCSMY